MLRHLLACSLALALASAPLCALPGQLDLAADCTVGFARGELDLPAGDQPGTVRGILTDAAGTALGFEGWLTPVRTRPDGLVRGRLEGALYPLKKDRFHPKAIATVTGTWTAGLEGRGRFQARIVELSPGKSEKATAAGKMAGVFSDPRRLDLSPSVGAFACRWTVCD